MRVHPKFDGFDAPRHCDLGRYRLAILGPDDLQEDYDAVVESTERLVGRMGGSWPVGLTLEEDLIDLHWHFKEFELNRSFAWIVRDGQGAYLGCAYVFPSFAGDHAEVALWVRSSRSPDEHEPALEALLMAWLQGPDWPEVEYRRFRP
ncbi:MAG: GNAT family N-acetyltransferase [Pseudomonadota bacterium]